MIVIVVHAALEMVSVGLVIPLALLLTSESSASQIPVVGTLVEDYSQSQLLIGLMVVSVVVYAVKNVVGLFLAYVQARLAARIGNRVVQKLFERYMQMPYEFHLGTNSAFLVRNVQENASSVVGNGVMPILVLATDLIVGLGLFGILVSAEPIGTLSTLVIFGLVGSALLRGTRRYVNRWGEVRQVSRGRSLLSLMQGFGSVKEVKLLGREDWFYQEHDQSLKDSARAQYLFQTFQSVPRALFEVLAMLGLCVLVVVMIVQESEIAHVVSVLALFAAASFRVLPSVNRVITSLQQLSYGRSPISNVYTDLLVREFVPVPQRSNSRRSFREIHGEDLRFRYAGADSPALDGVSFVIRAGDFVGFVGPSGAGKSTLIDVILGLLAPQEGTLRVDGTDMREIVGDWQSLIGYVPQNIALIDDTIRNNVALGVDAGDIDDSRVRKALELAQLWQYVEALPDALDTVIGERGVRMSGGQRQRLGIARALYHEPAVLVLDEATSALDTETEAGVMNSVERLRGDRTIIVVAHRLSTVRYCDRLYRLESGRVVAEGSYAAVIDESQH
jgi:ABC-type multidrug transport system fused ATPase/permease subunit